MPNDELVSLPRICLRRTTNNIVEYSAVIGLLSNAIVFGIRYLVVRLDSQLIVLQLSNVYFVKSPSIVRMLLKVHLLEENLTT